MSVCSRISAPELCLVTLLSTITLATASVVTDHQPALSTVRETVWNISSENISLY